METHFFGQSLSSWLIFLAYAVLIFSILYLIKVVVGKAPPGWLKKKHWSLGFLQALIKTKQFFLIFISLELASHFIEIPKKPDLILYRASIVSLLLQLGIWANAFISWWVKNQSEAQAEGNKGGSFWILGFVVRLVLFSLLFLWGLDTFGINITTLVTGLGVGGVAIALAVQNILGDLFSSLTIAFDKPFALGDTITVGDFTGKVENIGLKTTRLRSVNGEQLIFSNSDLLQSRIRNFERMNERRVLFSLGVTYETPLEKLQQVPLIIKEAIDSEELTRFDRSHFASYGNSALNFETVYWVLSSDMKAYMTTNQAINFKLFRRFQEEGIEFAYPTQTVFNKSPVIASPKGEAIT
jgi:small-conductance mechanosensitive channel